ncbi:hypothetical protein RBB78_17075 [Tunturiibacter empetritectus]|uniref:hypothetical protein n=1 Tax=Tunturiibacter empetritectus TaxID=3069691 RepID=UPI003D9B0EB7
MPKSSSLGETTIGFGEAVGAGRVTVWAVALLACAVTVPGLLPVLVRAMLHSAPGARVVGQSVARVKLVAVSWRFVAARLPRLRRVRLGESSVERARLGALVVLSLASQAAEPEQRLLFVQEPAGSVAERRVEGSAGVGEFVRGRS